MIEVVWMDRRFFIEQSLWDIMFASSLSLNYNYSKPWSSKYEIYQCSGQSNFDFQAHIISPPLSNIR